MIQNEKVGDSITNTSGDDMAPKYVRNIHIRMYNNKGEVVNKLINKNKRIVPNAKYTRLAYQKG